MNLASMEVSIVFAQRVILNETVIEFGLSYQLKNYWNLAEGVIRRRRLADTQPYPVIVKYGSWETNHVLQIQLASPI